VLNLALDSGSANRGAFLAVIYSLGLGLPFVIAAAGFSWATKSISLIKKHIRAINLFGGSLLIALGLLLVTGLWQTFMEYIAEVTRVFTPTI
jgi:cytochrome c-type biogenesis protein